MKRIVFLVAVLGAGCGSSVPGTPQHTCGPIEGWEIMPGEFAPDWIPVRGFPIFSPVEGPPVLIPTDAQEAVIIDAPLKGAPWCPVRNGTIREVWYGFFPADNLGRPVTNWAHTIEVRLDGKAHPSDEFTGIGGGGNSRQVRPGGGHPWISEMTPLPFTATEQKLQVVITNWQKRPAEVVSADIMWPLYLVFEIEGRRFGFFYSPLRWEIQAQR